VTGFEAALARRLRGARRLCVVGVGDELQPGDRLGMEAARLVLTRRLPRTRVVLAGPSPESFTAHVVRHRPDHTVVLDAARMGAAPGAPAVLRPGNLAGQRLSTHALPLSVVLEYLAAATGAPVTLVGIEPSPRRRGRGLTPAERAGAFRVAAALAAHARPPRKPQGGAPR
jgi:hydrogenase 3 maturation protease